MTKELLTWMDLQVKYLTEISQFLKEFISSLVDCKPEGAWLH